MLSVKRWKTIKRYCIESGLLQLLPYPPELARDSCHGSRYHGACLDDSGDAGVEYVGIISIGAYDVGILGKVRNA